MIFWSATKTSDQAERNLLCSVLRYFGRRPKHQNTKQNEVCFARFYDILVGDQNIRIPSRTKFALLGSMIFWSATKTSEYQAERNLFCSVLRYFGRRPKHQNTKQNEICFARFYDILVGDQNIRIPSRTKFVLLGSTIFWSATKTSEYQAERNLFCSVLRYFGRRPKHQ